jgi:hypothetical protein
MNEMPNDPSANFAGLVQLTDVIVDQIRKLAQLHEDGILTDEEFQAKKKELLSRL